MLTSRNVHGGRLVEIALGGLNYQIEHHLFPSMPARSPRRARPLVRAHCAAVGLTCAETGLIDSYRLALGHLHAVGRSGDAGQQRGGEGLADEPAVPGGVPAAPHDEQFVQLG